MRFVENDVLYDTDEMEKVITVCREPRPFGSRARVLRDGELDRTGPSRVDTIYLDASHGGVAVLVRQELMGGKAGGLLSSKSAMDNMHRRLGEPGLPARVASRRDVEEALRDLWEEPGVIEAYERLFGKVV